MTHAHAIFAMFGWPNLSNIKKFDKFPVGIFQRYTITIPYPSPSPLILIVKEVGGGGGKGRNKISRHN